MLPPNYALTVVTAPASEPVSLVEAKEHLRVSHDEENVLIEQLIQSAREQVENDTARALFTQTLRLSLDRFPSGPDNAIRLPRPPLASVSSIAYVDTAGDSQTLSGAAYQVDAYSEPGRVVPVYGTSWPSARCQPNAVTVQYVAGWTAGTMPAAAKQLVLLWVSHLYDRRDPVNVGNIVSPMPMAIETLTWRLRWGHY